MNAPTFDLQSHSVCSDGELTPSETVRAAHAAGVQTLALTDHDTVEGVPEAQRTAQELGIRLVPAVEISVLDPAAQDLHVCGYGVDPSDGPLAASLLQSRHDREHRSEEMAATLRRLGWQVDDELLKRRRAEGKAIGRPHLAQAVVGLEDNTERLAAEGLGTATDFLVAYLIEGKPAFTQRQAPSAAEAISLIHAAGGVAIWAHPFWDVAEAEAVARTADRFRSVGIDGLEVFYVTHTREQVQLLHAYCAGHHLLMTGSSDFHGPHHSRFNAFRSFSTYGLEPYLGPIGD